MSVCPVILTTAHSRLPRVGEQNQSEPASLISKVSESTGLVEGEKNTARLCRTMDPVAVSNESYYPRLDVQKSMMSHS